MASPKWHPTRILEGDDSSIFCFFSALVNRPLQLSFVMQDLRREIKVWHNFNHPNVVSLLGIASGFGNTISTVAPWISGGKLHEYLAEKDPQLDLPARFRLVIPVSTPPI